jgi:peptidoglycan/xylan/chitin deacetylase (PgdA/CDA1 family)
VLFRPPYGYFDRRVSALVARSGLRLVGWNVAVERFLHGRTPAAAAAAVARVTRPGDILLLHDGGGRRAATIATLRALLPLLRARGLRAVTVSRLLRAGRTASAQPMA